MLNANGFCQIESVGDKFTVHGQPILGKAVRERCAILFVTRSLERTTVRADSSSSRGHGDEKTVAIRVHLDGNTVADVGDKLTVDNVAGRIVSMTAQRDVTGYVDHFKVECEAWQ